MALSVRSSASSVPTVRERVAALAHEIGFTPDQVFEIGLAVGEACANAVMHAGTSASCFRVEAFERDGEVVITVSDPGEDTLPPLQRDPDRVGGLGLFLMRRLMDKISLDMTPSGTRLTMSRRKRAA